MSLSGSAWAGEYRFGPTHLEQQSSPFVLRSRLASDGAGTCASAVTTHGGVAHQRVGVRERVRVLQHKL